MTREENSLDFDSLLGPTPLTEGVKNSHKLFQTNHRLRPDLIYHAPSREIDLYVLQHIRDFYYGLTMVFFFFFLVLRVL